jgi:chemotaxis-related protein WspB
MLLLTFTAGANRYAVDVTRIVELVPKVELRSIPHAPVFLAGLLGYRGQVVPVIDLGLLLGADRCRDRLSTRIILVNDAPGDHNRWKQDRENRVEDREGPRADQERRPDLLGLVAEHVSDLTYVKPEQISPAPLRLAQVPYLDAIVEIDQGIVQLIAVDKIREASLQGSPFGQERALSLESSKEGSSSSEFKDPESVI